MFFRMAPPTCNIFPADNTISLYTRNTVYHRIQMTSNVSDNKHAIFHMFRLLHFPRMLQILSLCNPIYSTHKSVLCITQYSRINHFIRSWNLFEISCIKYFVFCICKNLSNLNNMGFSCCFRFRKFIYIKFIFVKTLYFFIENNIFQ